MDGDKTVKNWIYNTPYIIDGTISIEKDGSLTGGRIYLVDKATPLFNIDGKTFLTDNKNCRRDVLNFLQAKPIDKKSIKTYENVFIEGMSQDSRFLSPIVPEMTLISNPMPFFVISQFFERLSSSRKHAPQIAYTKTLLSKARVIYPLLRLILPNLDNRLYNVRETSLAKLYAQALNIPDTNPILKQILDQQKVKRHAFAHSLYSLVKNYIPTARKSTSIYAVNRKLSDLASGIDNVSVIRWFINNLAAEEHKWLVMIILRQDIHSTVVLKAIHPDALYVYNMSTDLKLLADVENITTHPIKPFQPIKPMLAQRKSIDQVFKKIQNYLTEIKFDGERIQVHKEKKKIALFSRNGANVTQTYQAIIPYLLKAIKTDRCILDGELLLWDVEKNKAVEFGWMKPLADVQNGKRLLYQIFDIVYLGDNTVIGLPLKDRKKILESIIQPIPTRVEIVKTRDVNNMEELKKMLNEAIMKGEEGLVIKDPNSRYYPGMRGPEWIKLKPQYIKGTIEDLDVIIIGGYYSETKQDRFTHYLVGIMGNDGKILSITSVGTGFTDAQRITLEDELGEYWTDQPQNNVDYGGQKPNKYIDPEDSRVITISAHQLQVNPDYGAGYSLRFPVFLKFRYDKDYNDVTTLEEIISWAEAATEKIIDAPAKSLAQKPTKKTTVIKTHLPTDISGIKIRDDRLSGREFAVLSAIDDTKENVERWIYAHGGKFVQNPRLATWAIIADKPNIRVENFIKANPRARVLTVNDLYKM